MQPTPEQKAAFGRGLARFRDEAGLSREQIAVAAEVSAATVGGWERGEYAPRSLQTVRTLEDATGAPPGQLAGLLGVQEEEPPAAPSDHLQRIEQKLDYVTQVLERVADALARDGQ